MNTLLDRSVRKPNHARATSITRPSMWISETERSRDAMTARAVGRTGTDRGDDAACTASTAARFNTPGIG